MRREGEKVMNEGKGIRKGRTKKCVMENQETVDEVHKTKIRTKNNP